MSKLDSLSAALLCVTAMSGCWKTTIPIGKTNYSLDAQRPQRCLVVMLPGFGDSGSKFVEEGFVKALRDAKLSADALVVEAHFGYYREGILMQRLWHDVLVPAKRRGYQQIWFVGVSMGGAGSLGASASFPERVSGAILLAPYLGNSDLLQEIKRAGGPASWKPGAAFDPARFLGKPVSGGKTAWQKDRDTFFRYLWSWSRSQRRADGTKVALYVGVGAGDSLHQPARMLASSLPASRVLAQEGGHDWDVWLALFRRFLAAGALSQCNAPASAPTTRPSAKSPVTRRRLADSKAGNANR